MACACKPHKKASQIQISTAEAKTQLQHRYPAQYVELLMAAEVMNTQCIAGITWDNHPGCQIHASMKKHAKKENALYRGRRLPLT